MSENPSSDPLAMLRSGRGLPDAVEVDDPIREQLLDAAAAQQEANHRVENPASELRILPLAVSKV